MSHASPVLHLLLPTTISQHARTSIALITHSSNVIKQLLSTYPIFQSLMLSIKHHNSMSLICQYQDSLLSIATFLSIDDVRSLSSTCSVIRRTLLSSEAATKQIWVKRLIDLFPTVCRMINEPFDCTTRITFQIDFQRAMDRLPCDVDRMHLSLPLISSLLPKRYPQRIDLNTNSGHCGSQMFRMYKGTISQIMVGDNDNNLTNSSCESTCTLIQFSGQVGTGNRSIRSDLPFPSNNSEVPSRRRGREWFTTQRRKMSCCTNRKADVSLRCTSSFLSRRKYMTSSITTLLPDDKCQHCHSTYGPFSMDENMRTNIGSATEMICTRDTHSKTIIQRLSRIFCNASTANKSFIPFIIPTVISESSRDDCNQYVDLLVDVTPRYIAYFEVTIVKQVQYTIESGRPQQAPINECVAIGLSTQSFQQKYSMPGWDTESIGYHSDDGGIFHGKGVAARHGQPTFGPGDTVGCGVEYRSKRIFFTKNAKFLGYEFGRLRRDFVENGLYPTVGIDTNCPIFVNFGEHPFTFNLKDIQDSAPSLKKAPR